MAGNTAEEHAIRLSSLDQAAPRVYHQYCLCFAAITSLEEIEAITKKLNKTLKRTVSQLPILAGEVKELTGSGAQKGRIEVVVTLDNVHKFAASITNLSQDEFAPYKAWKDKHMPARTFIADKFTPLADTPDPDSAPVFAVKAIFIPDGVFIALCLHHSVADVVGLGTIVSRLSNDLPSRKLTNNDLGEDTADQSKLRDRLSGSRGVKADNRETALASAFVSMTLCPTSITSRVVYFNMKLIDAVMEMASDHLRNIDDDRMTHLTSFHILAAVLWRGVARARIAAKHSPEDDCEFNCSLALNVDIRRIVQPKLDDSYLGNAELPILATMAALKLITPYAATTMAHTARIIHNEMGNVNEPRVRSTIAGINISDNVQTASRPPFNPEKDLMLTSWADLPLKDAHLNLGLGAPGWVRKVGRSHVASGCIVHPIKEESSLCEVTVGLEEAVMKKLMEDPGFMSFVVYMV